jgi:hypothetical protein
MERRACHIDAGETKEFSVVLTPILCARSRACRASNSDFEACSAAAFHIWPNRFLVDGRGWPSSFATRLKQNPLSVWKLDSNL